jgi:hypothetical protein
MDERVTQLEQAYSLRMYFRQTVRAYACTPRRCLHSLSSIARQRQTRVYMSKEHILTYILLRRVLRTLLLLLQLLALQLLYILLSSSALSPS